MQYTVEELSPVKKKVAVEIPAAEVDAALDKSAMQYRQSVSLPGFRKGKAPVAMIAKRYADEILNETATELVNGNISTILREMDVEPLTGIEFDNEDPLKRGSKFNYAFSFEVMPVFDLPTYEGVEVEQEKAIVTDEEIDRVIDRVRPSMAEHIDVTEKRLPNDGDVVTVNFAGFDQDGAPVEGVSGDDFQVSLGEGQVIPDFEALIRTILPGDNSQGLVTFPEDYGHKPLAGKPVTMHITVTKLQEKKLPEIDDEFAKKAGGFESVEAMRDSIRTSYMRNRVDMAKAKAQSKFLESLLEKVEFPLPEGMVNRYTDNIVADKEEQLERQNKEIPDADRETMRAEAKTEAEKYAKTQLFLLTAAKKEEVAVTPQEMEGALRQIASRGGHDIKAVHEHYMRNNMMPALRDRILADKAMDALYAKAAIKEIDPPAEEAANA